MEEQKQATTQTESPKVDYESEAKRLQAELENEKAEKNKLKIASDNASREAAEYKRKEKERMTVEEQAKATHEEQEKAYKAVIVELNKTKAESVFAKKGWDEKEYSAVITTLADNVPPDKMVSVANEIANLVKSREDKIAELTKTALVKETKADVRGGTDSKGSDEIDQYFAKKKKPDNTLKFD